MLTRDGAYAKFAAYFIEHYPETSGSLWATFGRLGSDVSCNMHIESYHRYDDQWDLIARTITVFRVVKKKFLQRLANRRVDVLIDVLLNDVAKYYEYILHKTVRLLLL
jgi:hypothetical protein